MNVKKLVAKNAMRAGASATIAADLGSKFERYHKDQRAADRAADKGISLKQLTEPSKADLQADKSKKELVHFVANTLTVKIVEETANQIDSRNKISGRVAAVWAGAVALVAACGYFVVNVIKTANEFYKGIWAGVPLPERAQAYVSGGAAILGLVAAGITTRVMNRGKEMKKDVAFDLRQIAKEAGSPAEK